MLPGVSNTARARNAPSASLNSLSTFAISKHGVLGRIHKINGATQWGETDNLVGRGGTHMQTVPCCLAKWPGAGSYCIFLGGQKKNLALCAKQQTHRFPLRSDVPSECRVSLGYHIHLAERRGAVVALTS